MLEVKHISMHYRLRGRNGGLVQALDDISLTVKDGETVALMGESGSGKSTLVRLICAFEKPTAGSVFWDGTDIFALARKRTLYKTVQPVFQDNLNCFDPRQKIKKPFRTAAELLPAVRKRMRGKTASAFDYGEYSRISFGKISARIIGRAAKTDMYYPRAVRRSETGYLGRSDRRA